MAEETIHTAPACIGIIMDGNRRWAKQRRLPLVEGHRRGYKKLKDVLSWCNDAGIRHVVVYAFSTENWNRAPDEIEYLLDLAREIAAELTKLEKEGVAVRFIGDLARFPDDLQKIMEDTNARACADAAHHLWVAASYGGRAEIVNAVNTVLRQGGSHVDEEAVGHALWSFGMPDPDLIIRTGGEQRLSNFMTWGSVYSELFFVETPWPDFTKEQFTGMLEAYVQRERRHGR